jgi:hypothetical protein
MILMHDTDIAIEPIDDRDALERAFQVNDEFYIPSSAKGIIKASSTDGMEIGSNVYFDPRMMVEIPALGIVIVDRKSILMKAE